MTSRQREFRNKEIFNTSGTGPGVWTGQGVTRTKRNRTLFVTMLPGGVEPAQIGSLFKDEPGFEGFRNRRRMCFVDFKTPIYATGAMRKFQGYKFSDQDKGLAIDYDKDHVSKRNKQYERQKRQRDASEQLSFYFCTCCGSKFLSLKGAPPLSSMGTRKTDGATALLEAYTEDLYALRGEPKKIKRPKGVERQYPLTCSKCKVQIAYRSVPLNKQAKFMYVLADALSPDPKKRVRVDEDTEAAAGSGAGSGVGADAGGDTGSGSGAAGEGAGASTGAEASSQPGSSVDGGTTGGGLSGSAPVPAAGAGAAGHES